MSIKAVAFDIDGTVYPDSALRLRSLSFGFRHMRLLAAMAEVRHELHLLAAGPRREGEPRDLASFRSLQASLLARRLRLADEDAARIVEEAIYVELARRFTQVPLYRGVIGCLEALKDAGLGLAVLSDFPVEGKLEALGVARFFPVRRTSEECGLLKPASLPFLSLAEELGIAPSEILYVGNSIRYDVGGAKGAGMLAALRTARPKWAMRHCAADFAFRTFPELADWVLTRTTPTP